MISPDLTTRLRQMTETAVQPLSAVRELPSDLPSLSSGQRFSADIHSALPDGTYRAIVAGRMVTLSLPQPAKAGDTLELVVIERTPGSIIANQTSVEAETPATPTVSTTLSRSGQLISALLAEGDAVNAKPRSTAASAPLLPAPPQSGELLAPLLRSAISESGLFYESHQAQWVAGRLPLSALLREPQGRPSPTAPEGVPAPASSVSNAPTPTVARVGPAHQSNQLVVAVQQSADVEAARGTEAMRNAAASRPLAAAPLPEDLAPLVRQQLDALASQHVLWQGQVWPGQTMDWRIDGATQERTANGEEDQTAWSTRLQIALPRLGSIAASVSLSSAGVAVALHAVEHPSIEVLQGGADNLAASMEAAGVPLLALTVGHGKPT